MYEADLESDVESEDEPESLMPKNMDPIEETLHDLPGKPSWVLLRERAQKNKGVRETCTGHGIQLTRAERPGEDGR